MAADPAADRLQRLEDRLRALEGKKKDWWDKGHIAGQFLGHCVTPVAVALIGIFIGTAVQTQGELAQQERQQQTQQLRERAEAARQQVRQTQLQLEERAVDLMTSEDVVKKKLGMRMALQALPDADFAKDLVREAIDDQGTPPKVKDYGKDLIRRFEEGKIKPIYRLPNGLKGPVNP